MKWKKKKKKKNCCYQLKRRHRKKNQFSPTFIYYCESVHIDQWLIWFTICSHRPVIDLIPNLFAQTSDWSDSQSVRIDQWLIWFTICSHRPVIDLIHNLFTQTSDWSDSQSVHTDQWLIWFTINKDVDIIFSSQDAFLEQLSSGTIRSKIFESQQILFKDTNFI